MIFPLSGLRYLIYNLAYYNLCKWNQYILSEYIRGEPGIYLKDMKGCLVNNDKKYFFTIIKD